MSHTHVQDGVAEAVPFPQKMMPLLAVATLLEQRLHNGSLPSADRKMQWCEPDIDDAAAAHWAKKAARHLMNDVSSRLGKRRKI